MLIKCGYQDAWDYPLELYQTAVALESELRNGKS
jgi:hypothetical protein